MKYLYLETGQLLSPSRWSISGLSCSLMALIICCNYNRPSCLALQMPASSPGRRNEINIVNDTRRMLCVVPRHVKTLNTPLTDLGWQAGAVSAVSLYKIKLNTTISVPCYCSLMDHFGSHSLRFGIGRREGGRYNWPAFLTHIQYVRSDNGSILGNSSHNSWQTCDMSSQMSRHDTRAHSDNPLHTQIFYYVNNLSLPKS